MENKNQKIIIAVIALVLVICLAYVKMRGDKDSDNQATQPNGLATTTQETIKGTALNGNGDAGYKVEAVPIENKTPKVAPPSLDKPVVFSTSLNFSDEIKELYTKKINDLKASIKSAPTSLLPWIDLGSYEKAVGNYQAALEDWTYVSKAAPTDYISLGNIGNLYAYYLKDNAMAETYYKKAIANGPKQTYLYIQLSEVYRDVFKDMDKAKAIIDQGLKILPGNVALLDFKSNLK